MLGKLTIQVHPTDDANAHDQQSSDEHTDGGGSGHPSTSGGGEPGLNIVGIRVNHSMVIAFCTLVIMKKEKKVPYS